MDDYTAQDAVNFAANGNGLEFKKAINALLMDRISDAVELKKSEVAANFLSVEDEAEDQNIEGDEYEDQEV